MPGHCTYSRLQLVTVLSNQILIALSSTVLWYGTSHCFVEQQLISSLFAAALSVVGCSFGRLAFCSIQNLDWEARQLLKAGKGPSKAERKKRAKEEKDRRKTVLPEWTKAALTSRVSSGMRAAREMVSSNPTDGDRMRFTGRWSSADSDKARSRWRWSSSSSRTSSRSTSQFSSMSSLPRNSSALGDDSSAHEGEAAVAARIVPFLNSQRESDEDRITKAALGRVPSGKAMSPSTATELRNARSTRNPALLRARAANTAKKRLFVKISSRRLTGSGAPRDVEAPGASTSPPTSPPMPEDVEPPLASRIVQHPIQRGKPRVDEDAEPDSGSVSDSTDEESGVRGEGSLSSSASLSSSPDMGAEAAERSVLDKQRHWIEKRVRWIEDAAEEPSTQAAGAEESSLFELWVPLDRLHHSQGGFTLIFTALSGSLSREYNAPLRRRCRRTIHGFEAIHGSPTEDATIEDAPADTAESSDRGRRPPTGAVMPVHSLGVTVLSQLVPHCMRSCIHDVVLVRISTTSLPSGLVKADLSVSKMKGGGETRSLSPCSPMVLIAWVFNLTVLSGAAVFLLFVYLVIFEQAEEGWTLAVLLSTLLSLGLSFAVYDILVCAFIAAIPVKSSRSRSPLDVCIQQLVGQCCD